MIATSSSDGWIARLRARIRAIALDYPTDPLSLLLSCAGIVLVLAALIASLSLAHLLIGLLSLAAGIAGLVTARGRYVVYTFRLTIGGATVALLAFLFFSAAYPVWWLAVLLPGGGLSAMVIYFFGPRFGLLWGAMQSAAAFGGTLLAFSTVPGASEGTQHALLLQAHLAGQAIIWMMHLGLVVLTPQQVETDQRASALSAQRNDLENLTSKIMATADGLSRASSAIHVVTSQQSSGAHQQAAAITQAVTMLTEFLALADRVRDQARGVAGLSERTAEISESGQQAIDQAIEGMAHIRTQMTAIAHNIAALAEQMQRIDEIITSVSEIATQSNLLALNASIEAARAGTQGRGFAVVADEVRSLSRQSGAAAMQVQAMLGEIQEAMKQTVRATQTGDQRVDDGLALSGKAAEVILLLADHIDESTGAVRSILAAIDEQTSGLEQIAHSMQGIHEVTQQNLASNRTAETVAETLNNLSHDLLDAIAEQTNGDFSLA